MAYVAGELIPTRTEAMYTPANAGARHQGLSAACDGGSIPSHGACKLEMHRRVSRCLSQPLLSQLRRTLNPKQTWARASSKNFWKLRGCCKNLATEQPRGRCLS